MYWGETIPDDIFSKGALQSTIESFLRALVLRIPRYKVRCEYQINEGYSDILLVDSITGIAVLIELARIRYKYINLSFKGVSTNRYNIAERKAVISNLTEDELLLVTWNSPERKSRTVADCLKEKKLQCEEYAKELRDLGETENIIIKELFSFAAVQVGERILVRACDEK